MQHWCPTHTATPAKKLSQASISLCVSLRVCVCFSLFVLPAWAGKFKQLPGAGEYNESHFCIAQNRQLVCLLQQTPTSLGECHLPARWILNLLNLYFPATHNLLLCSKFLQLVLSPNPPPPPPPRPPKKNRLFSEFSLVF